MKCPLLTLESTLNSQLTECCAAEIAEVSYCTVYSQMFADNILLLALALSCLVVVTSGIIHTYTQAWKAWDKRHKSENDPIAGLPDGQLYAGETHHPVLPPPASRLIRAE